MSNPQGITGNDVADLIAIFKEAEKRILDEISGKDLFKQSEAEKTLAQIRQILLGLEKPSKKFLEIQIDKEYEGGIKEAQKIIDGALGKNKAVNQFGLIDKKAIKGVLINKSELYDEAVSDLQSALENSYMRIQKQLNLVKKEVKDKLLETVATESTLGTPRKAVSEKLKQILEEKGITGFTYTTESGKERNLSLEAYVKGLAQSTMRNARMYATLSSAIDRGIDLLKFSSHTKPSPMCRPYQGQIVSITGKTPGYPTLNEAQTHYKGIGIMNFPYCRHTVIPYISTDIVFRQFTDDDITE